MLQLNYHFFGKASSYYGPAASGFQRCILLDATQGRYARWENGRLVPELLQSWQMEDEGRRWVLKLAEDRTFHTGRRIHSRDLEFSFIAPLLSTFRTPEFSEASCIVGAHQIRPGDSFQSGMLEGIRMLSETEIEIRLNVGDKDFLADLACNPTYSLFPQEELYAPGKDLLSPSKSSGAFLSWRRYPVGAGDYQIEQVADEGETVFLRRKRPYNDQRGFARVRLTVGLHPPPDIDILDRVAGFESIPLGFTLKTLPIVDAIYGVYFNFDQKIVRDLRFRQAIREALDPNEFSVHFQGGRPTDSLIPSSWSEWKRPDRAFSLDRAKTLFAALAKEFDLSKVSISTLGRSQDNEPNWLSVIKSRLREAGLLLQNPLRPDGELILAGFGPSVVTASKLFGLFLEGSGWVSRLQERDAIYQDLLQRLMSSQEPSQSSTELIFQLEQRWKEQCYGVPVFETCASKWVRDGKEVDFGPQDLCFSIGKIRSLVGTHEKRKLPPTCQGG